jgi:hypothetical protein
MILLLYAATAAVLLWLSHRALQPISRVAAVLLFLLPFCLTGFALVTDRVYAPIDFPYATEPLLPLRGQYGIGPAINGILTDIASQMIPWRKAVQWSLAHRQWPIHNPFILSGDILAAAAQPAAYSPFTLIACLLPVAKSMTYTAAIALFVAALGAFLFARDLGCRESSALIAAAGWMYSTDISFFILWPLGFSWTFLPLVLLGVRRVLRAPGARSAALLTTAFTLMLLAGHPETAVHIVLVAGVYALFEIARQRRDVLRGIIAAISAGVIALLLCAIYILPILEAAPQSAEHAYRTAHFAQERQGANAYEVLARLATDFFPFLHVRHWRVPEIENIPFDSAAAGSAILALAIYAVWRVRSPHTWFFAALAIFGMLARTEWNPLVSLMKRLPLLNITLNERLSFAAAFSLSILAAIGVEEVLRRQRDRSAAITAAIVLVVLAIGTNLILRSNLVDENIEMWGDYKIFAELAGLTAVATILLSRVPPRWCAAGILGAILVQRVLSERGFYNTFPARAAYPPVPIFEPLKKISDPFRVVGIDLTFIPGTSALYELEDVRGYEAMTLHRYVDTYRLWCETVPVWFNRVHDLKKPFLSFLNVRYAVVWRKYPVPDGWRVFATQRGCALLENTNVIERAFVPQRVTIGLPAGEALNQMSKQNDFRERAWIEAPVKSYERENGPGRITIDRRLPLRYHITADMQRDGWIVVSESAWNGWRAYVDGRRVKMQFANTAFLSVYVPQGRHNVRLVYLPDSFVRGRAITMATLAAITIFSALSRLRERVARSAG